MASFKGVTRFSISLPPSLLRSFDEAWKNMGYDSRSKAAHDAFHSFISEYQWSSKEAGKIVGVITLLYYLDKPELLSRIADLQHKFKDIVISSMHVHVSRDKCLEILAVRGQANEIRNLSRDLKTEKGVKQVVTSAVAL